MDLSFLRDNWGWISSNWWGTVYLVGLGVLVGAGLAKLYYQWPGRRKSEGISISAQESPERFEYSENGLQGKNILSNSVNDVSIKDSLSMRAKVPKSSRLTVELFGPIPRTFDDTGASWFLPLGQNTNWTYNKYIEDHGGKQQFRTEGGVADLKISFAREGTARIVVHEGDSTVPSWEKTLQVHDSA